MVFEQEPSPHPQALLPSTDLEKELIYSFLNEKEKEKGTRERPTWSDLLSP